MSQLLGFSVCARQTGVSAFGSIPLHKRLNPFHGVAVGGYGKPQIATQGIMFIFRPINPAFLQNRKFPSWRRGANGDFAKGQILLSRLLFDSLRRTLKAVGSEVANIRKRFIQRVDREIKMFKIPAEIIKRSVNRDKFRHFPVFACGFFFGSADNRLNGREDQDFIRGTAVLVKCEFSQLQEKSRRGHMRNAGFLSINSCLPIQPPIRTAWLPG